MSQTDDTEEDSPDGEDIRWAVEFLSEQPPYAAIGKVIHAGADLETGIFSLCRHYGLSHEKTWQKSVAKRVSWLKENSPVSTDILDRVVDAVEKRNLLAHGTWIRFRDQRAFIKHKKDDPENLAGELATEEVLDGWRAELQHLADAVPSHYLTARQDGASG